MRLKSIKLAGFKSFVDPTNIPFPSNRVAIVGPNGCGKSNVIDAVRWVMGESSAKYLRGESLADVIFSGSTSRQPVGQASVELNFDNAERGLGGEYASYSEILIKRQVTRDGQSVYYLNNTRCRRKDITDIFLGTGLGPRSYAIIEQGTISRLIEAKPEELRIYLEEAAGISKYKERRHETELRIQHTRDNLARLNDIREELSKQLEHLQRQANTAEKYKFLKEEERLLRAQLLCLRWQGFYEQSQAGETAIKVQELDLELHVTDQRHSDTELEKQRLLHNELSDTLHEVQGRYYSFGAEITRLEQTIYHHRERSQQVETELTHIQQAWDEAKRHIETDQQNITDLTTQSTALEPEYNAAILLAEETAATLADAEQSMHEWQLRWDTFNQEIATATKSAEIEQMRIQHLEQRIHAAKQRLEKLQNDRQQLDEQPIQKEIVVLTEHVAEQRDHREQLQQEIATVAQQISVQREQNQQRTNELNSLRSELQRTHGQHASLEALQQAALGKHKGAIADWLTQHQLVERPRLAQMLQVEVGWENAVETVLGQYLEAICVEGFDVASALFTHLPNGNNLSLFDTTATAISRAAQPGAISLLSKVTAECALDALLAHIYIADDLPTAVQITRTLSAHESVITPDGIWLGKSWLRVRRDHDEKMGVLRRERELIEFDQRINALTVQADALQQQLRQGEEAINKLEQQRGLYQQKFAEYQTMTASLDAQLRIQQSRLEQVQQRVQQLSAEEVELNAQITRDQQELLNLRAAWEKAMQTLNLLADKRGELTEQRTCQRDAVEMLREQARAHREVAHSLALRMQSLTTRLQATSQNQARVQKQLTGFEERTASLRLTHAELIAPLADLANQLEQILAKRLTVENELTSVRQQVNHVEYELREWEKKRSLLEQTIQQLRQQLEQKRMEWQGLQVRCHTLQEQLTEAGYQLDEIRTGLPFDATETSWEEQSQKVANRIERLGPINLAAIDEYAIQAERKTYLDAQNADLVEALETLETAIRKIDRETRARFKETYEKVNECFMALFPRIFAGGSAYLELTGEDLLDTGVTVMARPPGKRNATIHLLSGGEKALTAIALVFAIFQLNPAPFCMLDEVDAPLDDTNIGRFCDLVKEMSEKTQFIFISHNKLAMEMAQHLTGVTMHEPGVSRLVTVDVEEAIAMAST